MTTTHGSFAIRYRAQMGHKAPKKFIDRFSPDENDEKVYPACHE
jgi:hypothetical protein